MLSRNPHSHKGENGKVAVIGGSKFQHGAPIFSALAAEAGGVDLVFLSLPMHHAVIARSQMLNAQVHPFVGEDLTEQDVPMLLELLATVDCAVIGPGLARHESALQALKSLISSAPCPLVLDATALQPWTLASIQGRHAILTPHLGELERMGIDIANVSAAAKEHDCTIHVKRPTDMIVTPDGTRREVGGGTAGLTVGGTGDALAGLIGGLTSQGVPHIDACAIASTVMKRAATVLFPERGYAIRTTDVIERIPHLLNTVAS